MLCQRPDSSTRALIVFDFPLFGFSSRQFTCRLVNWTEFCWHLIGWRDMRSKTHKLNSKLVSSQTQKFGYSASVGFVIYEIVFPFTSVTKERTEVIFQGTRNLTVIPDEEGGIWEEYQFKCKPGDPRRRPCLISPYHYRLDWLMWFAAFQVSVRNGSPVRNNIS